MCFTLCKFRFRISHYDIILVLNLPSGFQSGYYSRASLNSHTVIFQTNTFFPFNHILLGNLDCEQYHSSPSTRKGEQAKEGKADREGKKANTHSPD